ncbi:pyridoxamine 5'-phosphate oxidase family protein [Patescibacteria group bacterium]
MNYEYKGRNLKDYIESVKVMSVAVTDEDKPVSSVVLFMLDNDLCFYFLTKRITRKAIALGKNPKISISLWRKNELLINAFGEAREIPNITENSDYFDKFRKLSQEYGNDYWPLEGVDGSEYVLYKMMTQWMKVVDLSSSGVGMEEEIIYFD